MLALASVGGSRLRIAAAVEEEKEMRGLSGGRRDSRRRCVVVVVGFHSALVGQERCLRGGRSLHCTGLAAAAAAAAGEELEMRSILEGHHSRRSHREEAASWGLETRRIDVEARSLHSFVAEVLRSWEVVIC
jgi:hypothetical protein